MKDNYVKFVIKKIQNIINVKRVKKKFVFNVLKNYKHKINKHYKILKRNNVHFVVVKKRIIYNIINNIKFYI